jgi:DNA topoisomerase-3
MTIVVIAEKPSVARDIARVLGAGRKGQGCLEGNGYCVTWALGHLVHLAEPDDYGPPWKGRWSAGQLPMIPDHWRLKLAPKTADQFKVVKALINDPATERLVCATDAGREGEHIFRLIYEQARCRKPFDRLWVSSLTDEAIRAGFRALKPGSAYDDLGRAARARAQADWLIGMNLTRAYTVHNGILCTIGRVQTPTLAMICARDAEIAAFTKTLFYELLAHLAEGFTARYTKDGETRIDKKEDAERLQREIEATIEPQRTGTVRELEQQVQHNRPPPLYDLTSLQREANRRFGLTAAQVLELAQSLYETYKLISYPRTESRHIGEDMVDQLPGILKGLDHPQAPVALVRLASGHRLGRAYVDQTKLTDHHAILPTGRPVPAGLSGPLRQVFELVQTRFVSVFLPDQVVEETRVLLAIGGADFVARGSRVLDPGWTVADGGGPTAPVPVPGMVSGAGQSTPAAGTGPVGEGGEAPAAANEEQALPPLTVGQTVHIDRLEARERETSPPRPYTDASLLAAMKNAGRTIEDRDLARAMKASGLGTPATRAETIEKLIRTGYVERQRKQLRATGKGRGLIERVALPLKSPELTAAWEQRLREVEEGSRPVAEFDQGIRDLVCDLVPRVWQGPAFSPEQVSQARAAQPGGGPTRGGKQGNVPRPARLGPCPLCGQGELMETGRAYGCSRYREGCAFTVWKTIAGIRLTKDQVRELVGKRRTGPIDGFLSKAGKTFSAGLKVGGDGRVEFDFCMVPQAVQVPGGDADSVPAPPLAKPDGQTVVSTPDGRGPVGLVCPKCGQGRIIQGHRGFGCDRYREGCNFAILRQFAGKVLTDLQISSLIRDGRTRLIKGFSDGKGNRFDARLELDPDYQVRPRQEA